VNKGLNIAHDHA